MNKKTSLIFLTFFSLSACNTNFNNTICLDRPTENNGGSRSEIIEFEKSLIIKFKEGVTKNKIEEIRNDYNLRNTSLISPALNIYQLETNSEQTLKELQKNKFIEYAVKDSKMNLASFKVHGNDCFTVNSIINPNDPFYGQQWNVRAIEADKAWAITTGSEKIRVAVIDSGVDPNHPDLVENIEPMIDMWELTGNTDIYKNGGTTINYGGKDGNGHGTHVTGILAAAINNGKGIAGIAGNVKILPIKAANHQGVTSASILTKAINRAIEEKVKVINLSIGGPRSEGTKALEDSVKLAIEKGIVFVSATGNESTRNRGVITDVTVPAAYPGVISVSAVTINDKVANYSNGGPEVEIAAPGGGGLSTEGQKIYSTWPTYKTFEGFKSNITGPYANLSGTSMASPHVAAVAALLFTIEPNITAQQVRVRILSTTEDVGTKGFDQATGYGKLNAYKALIANNHDLKNR